MRIHLHVVNHHLAAITTNVIETAIIAKTIQIAVCIVPIAAIPIRCTTNRGIMIRREVLLLILLIASSVMLIIIIVMMVVVIHDGKMLVVRSHLLVV